MGDNKKTLTAQPQAKPCTKPDCFPFCDCGGVDDAPQASAAQSAPAGEREAQRAALDKEFAPLSHSADQRDIDLRNRVERPCFARGFTAGAAWQRAQSAPVVPEGWREFIEDMAEMAPPEGVVVAADWMFATGIRAKQLLAAAPAQPAAQDRARAALSPENQRVAPVEPLLANPHPLAAAQGVETHQINCNAVSQYPAGKCNCGKGE